MKTPKYIEIIKDEKYSSGRKIKLINGDKSIQYRALREFESCFIDFGGKILYWDGTNLYPYRLYKDDNKTLGELIAGRVVLS